MKVIPNNREIDLKAFSWEKLRNQKQKGLDCLCIYLLFEIIKEICAYFSKLILRVQKRIKRQKKCIGTFLTVFFFFQCIFHSSNHVLIPLVDRCCDPYIPGTVLGRHFFGRHWSAGQFHLIFISTFFIYNMAFPGDVVSFTHLCVYQGPCLQNCVELSCYADC